MNLKGYDLSHLAEFLTELRAAEESHTVQFAVPSPLPLYYEDKLTNLVLVRDDAGELCVRAQD